MGFQIYVSLCLIYLNCLNYIPVFGLNIENTFYGIILNGPQISKSGENKGMGLILENIILEDFSIWNN